MPIEIWNINAKQIREAPNVKRLKILQFYSKGLRVKSFLMMNMKKLDHLAAIQARQLRICKRVKSRACFENL